MTKLKDIFTDIQRLYFRGDDDCNRSFTEWLLSKYDRLCLINKDDVTYDSRDEIMIDRCDVMVTYCDLNRELTGKWKSSTARNIAYAWKNKKRVINLFES